MSGHLRICFGIALAILLASVAPVSGQQSVPVWVQKLKLSGLTGQADRRLAVINNKIFAPGEENDLKVAGKNLRVKCLEISKTSVLVQIQGFPDPYTLTIDGEVYSLAPPAAAVPTSQVVPTQTPQPAVVQRPAVQTAVQPVSPFDPARSQIPLQPINDGHDFSGVQYFAGILFAGFIGVVIGAAAVGARVGFRFHRKNIGEAMVAETIHQQFKRPHLLLNNITLPTAEGTTQIDHILVVDTGIFVIETKHFSGWIFGNPKEAQWTQTIYRTKQRFPNPLRQNYGHIKTVQALFNLPEDHFHTVVVFTGGAEFKTDLGPNVLYLASLTSFLEAQRPVLFDERKMAYVIGRIEMEREQRSRETDEYHINHVRGLVSGRIPKRSFRFEPVSPSAKSEPPANPNSEHPHARYMPRE